MTQALDDEDMSVSDVSSGSSKASSGARSDSADLPVRILLVEDDALTQKIVTRLLSSLNFEVTTASNGCDAFALLKKARKQRLKFDAILTDEKMPHMTGTGLAKLLTASSEWRRIPVFLMSSEVTEAMRLEAVHTGIVKVFSKPITSQTLQGVWRNVLHRRSTKHSRHLTETKSAAKHDTGTDYQSCPDEARSPTVKREHATEEPKAKKPRTISLSSPGSQATNPDKANDKHGEDTWEEDKEKPVRASSLIPSKTFSGTYDIRAYSLPAPLLVKDFLPASIIPGPKLEVSELDIKPLNINAGIFPFSSLAQERQRLNIKTGLKSTDPRASEGEGSQVAASLCQLHHSTNNSAFQTFDSSGSGSVLQMLSNKQTTPVAASPTLRAPSFKIPPEIMHAHQGKVSDAFQAAAQQQKQADVCAANRKAAILRFKAKRQQRSFEKKVRYASRKRLAEQRPRIKGQFVKAADLQAYKAGTLT